MLGEAQAIRQSGILDTFPHIDIETQKAGIFGKQSTLDAPRRPGRDLPRHHLRSDDGTAARDGDVGE